MPQFVTGTHLPRGDATETANEDNVIVVLIIWNHVADQAVDTNMMKIYDRDFKIIIPNLHNCSAYFTTIGYYSGTVRPI